MKKTLFFFINIIGLIILSLSGIVTATIGGTPQYKPINQYQYQERVQNGTLVQYQFQQKTTLQFYGNVNATLDMDCDAESIGEQNLSIIYVGQSEVQLQIRLNATHEGMNLTNQNRIRVRNGSIYEYKYMLICNLSRNTTDNMLTHLRLRIREQDRNSTWAWYNATNGEFETMQSWYENGELYADTTHYTTFVVLTGIYEDNMVICYTTIIISGVVIIGIIFLIYAYRPECENNPDAHFCLRKYKQ